MDREEAQHILQLCRPDNAEDRNDPLIADALARLNHDTDLRTWFEAQQALDHTISAEFSKVEPPADLKTAILVGMRAHALQSEQQQDAPLKNDTLSTHAPITDLGTIPFSQSTRPTQTANSDAPTIQHSNERSSVRPWMGIAAIFAIAGVALVLPNREATTELAHSEHFAAEHPTITTAGVPNMIEFLANQISDFNGSKFDKRSETVGELQSHLARTGMPNPAQIPQQLQALETLGCVTFDYDGTKLSMICFKNGQIYHLITANKTSVPSDCTPCAKQKIKVFESHHQAFKIWSEGEQVFILTTEGTKEDLPDCI